MKKILISAAICSMLFTAGASANWITGEPSIMAVNGGEAASTPLLVQPSAWTST